MGQDFRDRRASILSQLRHIELLAASQRRDRRRLRSFCCLNYDSNLWFHKR